MPSFRPPAVRRLARHHRRVSVVALLTAWMLLALPALVRAETPEFSAPLLNGGETSLAEYRGKVVLLNSWATWCEPCKEEMPELQRLSEDYADDGLVVLGASIDRRGADDRIAAFTKEYGVTFPILLDPTNAFAATFHTRGVPQSVLIGRDGSVVHTWQGAIGVDPTADAAAIEAALSNTSPVTITAARVGIPVAFAAGVLSFLSPCVLPLVPVYVGILTGMSVADLSSADPATQRRARSAALRNGALFVIGFSLVFIALGASATAIGTALGDNRVWLSRIGGVVLLVLGLHLVGWLHLPFLDRAFQMDTTSRPAGLLGSLLIGIAFGAAWTPCIGPALATVLTLAASTATVRDGMLLLAVYAVGLAVPFLLSALLLDRFLRGSNRVKRWLPQLQIASGILVIAMAILLLTDSFARLVEFFA